MSDRNGHPAARNGDHRDGNGRNPWPAWSASEGEMGLFAGIDADAERLVRGEAPRDAEPELVELAALMRELRATYARPPAEGVGERQLAAIVAEAATVSAGSAVAVGRDSARAVTWQPPARRGRTHAFRLAAAGLATLLVATGLAIAGVKPPGPVDDVLERIGIGGGDAAKPAGEASEGSSSGKASEAPAGASARDGSGQARGGDRGRDAGAARDEGRSQGDAGGTSQGEPGTPARGDEHRSATGTTNSAPGRATADEARTGSAPPQSPGRSGDHAPDTTGPPAAPGPQGAVQGREPRSEGNKGLGLGQVAEALDRGGSRR
jgi:hypothetical protein